jgi:hypothetical protein
MTKNIIIAVLTALLLLTFLFGISQKTEASKQRDLVIALEERIVAAKIEVEEQKKLADANAVEAVKQAGIAQEVLKNCKGHK